MTGTSGGVPEARRRPGRRGPWAWLGVNLALFAAVLLVFSAVLTVLDDRRLEVVEVVAGSVYVALISLVAYLLPLLAFLLVLWVVSRRCPPSLLRMVALGLGLLLSLGALTAVLLDDQGTDVGKLVYAVFPLTFGAVVRLPRAHVQARP